MKTERSCVLTSYPYPSVTVYTEIILKNGFEYSKMIAWIRRHGGALNTFHAKILSRLQVYADLLSQHTLTAVSRCQELIQES